MTKVNFRTNVLLKSILGKDLITDDNIAILELVKNSFDAGSPTVDVIFKNIKHAQDLKEYKRENQSEIIIADYGKGMSEYDLINKWLNIAYSEKKIKKEEFNRTLAGNKGVGRFSCDRLGKYLTIYTKQKGCNFLKLLIDWRKFEQIDDIDLNIQDIEFDLESITNEQFTLETKLSPFTQGTILIIKSLREEWNHAKILSLRRQLEKLINPNQSFKSEKFSITIKADELINLDKTKSEYEQVNGLVENKIFQKLNFKVSSIQSKISRNGDYIITILKDKGINVFTLIEKNPFNLLKNIKIHLYYLNPYAKAYFRRQTGLRSVEFGSISLFINGFRIPPYGDAGDDWLGMENRKNQGRTRYLGTREVIGRIEILNNEDTLDDEEGEFKIISSRSGVRNNDVFNQLAKDTSPYGYYYRIFRRLERFVVEGIKWDSVKEKDYNKLERKILEDAKWNESKEEYILDSLKRNKQIVSVIDKIVSTKNDEVISLKINTELISNLIDQQKEKSLSEINAIAEEISNKELTSSELGDFLNRIKVTKKELDEFPLDGEEILQLKQKQVQLEERLEREEQQKRNAELEAARLAKELELEKEKNTYLRTSSRDLSEDAKGLVHNIKITSKKISNSVDNLYDKILTKNYNEKQLLKSLGAIKFQSEKALKISKIITRSNFNTDKNAQIVDLVKYIKQYINVYSDILSDNDIEFKFNDNNAELIRKISILDISVILDDLISNSEKAGAKNIQLDIWNPAKDKLKILFSDDGQGVPEKFLDIKNTIFELGVTTTIGGSGIGLNSVKTGLKSMKGDIAFLGNGINLKGACFEITFD